MAEKDIEEIMAQMGKWYEEDTDNRAVICIKTDKETGLGNSFIFGSRLNLVALLTSIAVKNEEFRKLFQAANRVLENLKQPIETSVHVEKDEGNTNIS